MCIYVYIYIYYVSTYIYIYTYTYHSHRIPNDFEQHPYLLKWARMVATSR